MAVDIWSYRATVVEVDLSDFHVEALDGEIGKVDPASYEAGGDSIIVDTGPLVFGRKVFLPVGTIERIDPEEKRIYVGRTQGRDQACPRVRPLRDTPIRGLGSRWGTTTGTSEAFSGPAAALGLTPAPLGLRGCPATRGRTPSRGRARSRSVSIRRSVAGRPRRVRT